MLATALSLSCAICTEDTDFFGAGVAVWTSDRVDIFLKEQSKLRDSEEIERFGKSGTYGECVGEKKS